MKPILLFCEQWKGHQVYFADVSVSHIYVMEYCPSLNSKLTHWSALRKLWEILDPETFHFLTLSPKLQECWSWQLRTIAIFSDSLLWAPFFWNFPRSNIGWCIETPEGVLGSRASSCASFEHPQSPMKFNNNSNKLYIKTSISHDAELELCLPLMRSFLLLIEFLSFKVWVTNFPSPGCPSEFTNRVKLWLLKQ